MQELHISKQEYPKGFFFSLWFSDHAQTAQNTTHSYMRHTWTCHVSVIVLNHIVFSTFVLCPNFQKQLLFIVPFFKTLEKIYLKIIHVERPWPIRVMGNPFPDVSCNCFAQSFKSNVMARPITKSHSISYFMILPIFFVFLSTCSMRWASRWWPA